MNVFASFKLLKILVIKNIMYNIFISKSFLWAACFWLFDLQELYIK